MSKDHTHLSRRERQIMDVLYELREATAADVLKKLPSPPSYSAVRAMLAKLEKKGHVRHQQQGKRYVFAPVVSRSQARDSALTRLVTTFFNGSAAQAATRLLGRSAEEMTDEELDEMAAMIDKARRRERTP